MPVQKSNIDCEQNQDFLRSSALRGLSGSTNISEKNFEKYSRQIMMEKIGVSGQKKIMKSSICIIGCGGLGTTTAQYLAMTGVGKILLIDFDNIELSNLNRQISFLEADIGKNKVHWIETSRSNNWFPTAKELENKFKGYFFDRHKGYSTKLHKSMIKKYGVTNIHRKSFRPIKQFLNE